MIKKLCFAFALSMSFALAFTIASCASNGSGGGEENNSSSSKAVSIENPDYIIDGIEFEWVGNDYKSVAIEASGKVKKDPNDPQEKTFDKVVIEINSVKINTDDYSGKPTFYYTNPKYELSGETCGKTITLYVGVYAEGNTKETQKDAEKKLTAPACQSSSSFAVPSSSSIAVVNKALTKISFGGSEKATIWADQGVILSTGTTAATAEADVYYNASTEEFKSNKSEVEFLSEINLDDGFGCQNPMGDITSTPNSNKFIPCGKFQSGSVDIIEGGWYIVRTNTSESWSAGWYLVRALDKLATNKSRIEIEAWKF